MACALALIFVSEVGSQSGVHEEMRRIRTLYSIMLTHFSTPTSHMSNTRLSYMRTNTKPSGRFFVLCPMTNKLASFFCAQNSSEDASSNGLTVFFLENDIAFGRLRAIYQDG